MMICSICGSQNWKQTIQTNQIVVKTCLGCGIDVCEHLQATQKPEDYDKNWQLADSTYLKSLESLRQLQAQNISQKMIELFGKPNNWCDFGTGRGWFPKALKLKQISVIGVDASASALEYLRAEKIETALVDDFNKINSIVPGITGLSLLDVLEHFKISLIPEFLKVLSSNPNLKNLIIKVPINNGFFYQLSIAFARLGATGPLETLFQVGTSPPHEVYFSEFAMEKLLNAHGFKLLMKTRDLDFEPKYLFARIFKRNFPLPIITSLFGKIIEKIIQVLKKEDSVIFYFQRSSKEAHFLS